MKKDVQKRFYIALGLIILFVLYTTLLCVIDVEQIGPMQSSVGFAQINKLFHSITGVHMVLYVITDWLGLVPVAFGFGFAILGLVQWIKRRKILKVDSNILILGMYYIIVIAAYLFFEIKVINYRPILINGYLEASYPSSTTLLVMCVMPTAIMQLNMRIKNIIIKRCVSLLISGFIAFMIICRLISGVHWLTDIIGGAIFSIGIVMLYKSVCELTE